MTTSISSRRAIFVIGAQKSGTTSLYDALARHSAITPCRIKEPQFFALEPSIVRRHIDWYASLFETGQGPILDGSTSDLVQKGAANLIAEAFDTAHIIAVLRNPVQRAHSGYVHLAKREPPAERRAFDEVLAAIGQPAAEDLFQSEDDALRRALIEKNVNPDFLVAGYDGARFGAPFLPHFVDELWPFRYFHMSSYPSLLAPYQSQFVARILVVFFEELVRNPDKVLRQVLEFLDLPAERLLLQRANVSRIPRNRLGRTVTGLKAGTARNLDLALARVIPRRVVHSVRRMLYKPKEALSVRNRSRAEKLLASEVDYWVRAYPAQCGVWLASQ